MSVNVKPSISEQEAQPVREMYHLSQMQEEMFFDVLYGHAAGTHVNQAVIGLNEQMDPALFAAAWEQVVSRHQALRTSFEWVGLERPLQVAHSRVDVPFEVHDFRRDHDADANWALFLRKDRERGFDLTRPPLMRVAVCRLEECLYRVLWTFHHLLVDGRSYALVLDEVFKVYEDLVEGRGSALPSSPPFADYIRWLDVQDWSTGAPFWRGMLAGFSQPPTLRIDAAPPGAEKGCGLHVLVLSQPLTSRLKAFAEREKVTLHNVLQAAWCRVLACYTSESDVVFGSPRACRRWGDAADGAPAVGVMVNTVPFRTQMRGDQCLSDWLQSLRGQQVAIRPYEHTPLREVRQWSEVRSGKPLFETILAFDNHSLSVALRNLGGNWLNRTVELIEQPPYPLTVAVHADSEMKIRLFYSRDRFADAAIADLGSRFQLLLDAIPENSSCFVRDLPLMSAAERAEVLGEWNATTTAYPRDESVAAVFEAQVAAAPEAVAVTFAGEGLSYGALNARANQLAHELRARGVGPDVPVGLCVERSLEMVVGLLGILKAGGAYVPLDPLYPAERLAFMVEDTQVRLVLTQARFRARFGEAGLCLDEDGARLAERSVANPAPLGGPEHLAYLIYTSGSTGQPKAVAVPQRAVVRLVKGTTYVELGAQDVFLQFAPLAFDASTFEIWGALLNGGRLVVFPPDTPSLEDLGRVVREQGVTTLWLTAGLFHQMIETAGESLRGLKQLLAGGDVLSAAHVRQALRKLPGCRLINGYGPTENTTFTCCHSFGSAEEVGTSVPIGRPIANTRVYVLDGVGAPVPVGVAGELYIGGDGLARGYWARPELTAERFVASGLDAGGRLYRTGDLVRWRPDGVLEFLGRRDGQVKIRGFRVEVGEIEALLSEHAAVQQVAVAARDADAGGKRLVAYVVAPGATVAALRDYVRARVPDYMVPSLFVFLDALPLTANGKVDRAALPAPETMTVTGTRKLARTPLEQQLSIIWAAVLGVDDPDIHTSFFDLGGHSLLATQVISRIAATVNVELPIRRLFESPTIAGLAEAVAERRDFGVSAPASPIVPVARLPHAARRDTELRKSPPALQ